MNILLEQEERPKAIIMAGGAGVGKTFVTDKFKKAAESKGWEMYESKRTQEENVDKFLTVKKLFDLENPKHSPIFTELRTQVKKKD